MAAVARGNYGHLKGLCVDPTCPLDNGRGRVSLITQLNVHSVMPNRKVADAVARVRAEPDGLDDDRLQAVLESGAKYYAPVAQILKQWTSDVAAPYVAGDQAAASTFQRLEVLLDLIAVYEESATEHFTYGASYGLYANRSYGEGPEVVLLGELQDEGESWGPVGQGLFGGSAAKAAETFEALQGTLDQVRQQRW